jgi:hypothetical protein
MNNSVIVWGLETVPDLRGYAAANGVSAATDDEVREAIGDKFPKHIYHSIVCIVAHREQGVWVVDALGAPHAGDRNEKQFIIAFADKIAELSPQLPLFTLSTSGLRPGQTNGCSWGGEDSGWTACCVQPRGVWSALGRRTKPLSR